MHQLLATFYVESDRPSDDITVTAEVQSFAGGTWSADSTMSAMMGGGNFFIEVGNAHHTNGDRRYKIDVKRRDVNMNNVMPGSGEQFSLFKAGTYERRLMVKFNSVEVLTRMIYLTIQPDLKIYRVDNGVEVPLVTTTLKSGAGSNPANHVVEVKPVNQTIIPDKINLGASNKFKDTVFIKTNLPIDTFCEDFSLETEPGGMMMSVSTWLRLAEKIRMTRKIGTTVSQWSAGTPPMGSSPIKTDTSNKKYAEFIADSGVSTTTYYTGAELGLEKLPLVLPLRVESELKLHGLPVDRYTGIGTTKAKTTAIVLQFTVILKTPHAIKITPEVLTLDEDNNYTSFIAVEANDEASWTLAPVDSKLTITPTSGTGRAAVVVKKAASYTLSSAFVNVSLTANSTVNATAFPDIDGSYAASDSSAVHLEKYEPTTNALIPRNTGSKIFDQTLTDFGLVGTWVKGTTTLDSVALDNLTPYPAIESSFSQSHRVRSWSLQSVGTGNHLTDELLATTLVLQGRTLDGNWKILDVAPMPSTFYSNDKVRVDRTVQHREVVDKIRISAIEVKWGSQSMMPQPNGKPVWFPKIQVFAGVPIIPTMTSAMIDGVSVQSSGSNNGILVFDRKVSGGAIPSVGSAAWYLNNGNITRNCVAKNGVILRVLSGDYLSRSWLAISFSSKRLLGYRSDVERSYGQADNVHSGNTLAFGVCGDGAYAHCSDMGTSNGQADDVHTGNAFAFRVCSGRAYAHRPYLERGYRQTVDVHSSDAYPRLCGNKSYSYGICIIYPYSLGICRRQSYSYCPDLERSYRQADNIYSCDAYSLGICCRESYPYCPNLERSYRQADDICSSNPYSLRICHRQSYSYRSDLGAGNGQADDIHSGNAYALGIRLGNALRYYEW